MGAVSEPERQRPYLTAVRRAEERVTPLELFFDLVFVLAHHAVHGADGARADWDGLGEGPARARRAVVGVGRLRLADQRRGPRGGRGPARDVRGDGGDARGGAVRAGGVRRHALLFACAYAAVRIGQIALFVLASRDDPELRHSVAGLRDQHGDRRAACWSSARVRRRRAPGRAVGVALVLDMGGPLPVRLEGWKLVPGHFAERHGLIIIIALGESIVAIGVGAQRGVDAGVVAAAVLGIAVAGRAVVAVLRRRRAGRRAPAGERAEVGPRAERDRARLVLLPALPDGRRHRAAGARDEEDAGRRRRAT